MKKNLFIPALIFSLGFSGNAYPMAWIAANLTKEGLKKTIEKATTGLHWGIAAGPIWGTNAYALIEIEKLKKNIKDEEFSKQEYLEQIKKQEEWIRQELKSLGYSDWNTIDLVPSFKFGSLGDFRTKSLFYNKYEVFEAYNEQHPSGKQFSLLNWVFKQLPLLNKLVENKKEKYNELRYTLSHEISHLKNNDSEKAVAIGSMTPFITHLVSKKIASLANVPIPNFALRNGLKIISGFGKLAINMLPAWVYLNFAEKNADENVVNDIEVLEGAARLFRRFAKYASYTDLKNLSWQERLTKLVDPHEESLKRAERFEERIAQLKNSKVSK